VHSDNTVYAQLTQLVGPKSVVKIAHRLGIHSQLDNYFAIGLGAEAVNPLEMARAFSAFASGGYRVDGSIFGNEPRAVLSVQKPEAKRPTDNRVVPHRMLRRSTALTVNSILQRVVTEGTGHRAALSDRPAAGKTGTTENYGDAWFVGYTPQLVAAVWVGYPNTLRPMLTEYHGEPVAGGTFPALIWKTFMESALAHRHDEPSSFDPPPFLSGTTKRVVRRDGQLLLDNGRCRGAQSVVYFSGYGPVRTARCKPNEVEVPHVVGQTIANAEARLAAQPLTPVVAYQPAKPLQRIDRVIAQSPARGRLSSYDEVTLFLPKPLHGVIPKLVGLSLDKAKAKLRRLGVQVDIAGFTDGPVDRVVAQAPAAGVAAAPDMTVSLVVGRG
jgi:membrane peptidoglycan carboxypeptidase